ncbi:MAG: HlyD family type I secretion periplasmic adaptor subunit [Rhodospirillum sp.]|nr:HlyD family type I secretion periplasmic adaptor subunit [Rhodospirillum sp.]MCF8488550.1 HlyD family type I secretion periplasmic adaptor subunit [Rhodospirillum sp.]MCF8499146.1 HlyD family type I secretion periplasmic adaptor subunit [Rhodospirillum sp.]
MSTDAKTAPLPTSPAPSNGPSTGPKVSPLETLRQSHPLPTWRRFAWTVMALFGAFLIWASQAQLDEVATAPGEVAPEGKTKIIQHLEGGIITEIFVQEGDSVTAGAPLVRLTLPTTSMNREEIVARLDALRLSQARLAAEAEGTTLSFPPEIAERRPELVKTEREAHEARLKELGSSLKVLVTQKTQRQNEAKELEAQLTAARANLEITQERYGISANLMKDGLTNRMNHLEIAGALTDLKGQIQALEPAIERAKAAIGETEERERETLFSFRREALEMTGQAEQEISRLTEMMTRANDQQGRTLITAPTKGVVKNVKHSTIGGVINPGEAIMEIVPVEDTLIVNARLSPMDRGYVTEGQKATVKVSTFDYARYGGLEGTVTLVAPDTTIDDKGQAFYRVQVRTRETHLGDKAGEYEIKPGMEAIVDIHTGERTVMEFLVKPVLKLRHEAFRER